MERPGAKVGAKEIWNVKAKREPEQELSATSPPPRAVEASTP
jgi:hypothetical protein